eukprot:CAMPEP_0115867684 /NCGR_PEP_ID=MMETSP0287-20121206/20894_1 /TAXON_ID=412157 /ORGANISM="Chrysochromulina rotalis, Strain UIO044" /LENGTH=51 /DNA_ID=CAMNT_0003322295 /DNA_START=589 /DNA_END=744 /DNA_ORIENTATION=-
MIFAGFICPPSCMPHGQQPAHVTEPPARPDLKAVALLQVGMRRTGDSAQSS